MLRRGGWDRRTGARLVRPLLVALTLSVVLLQVPSGFGPSSARSGNAPLPTGSVLPPREPPAASTPATRTAPLRPAQMAYVLLLVTPASACGASPVEIGGQPYGNGSTVSLDPAMSPFTLAIPPLGLCPGFLVTSVRAGPSPGVSLGTSSLLPSSTFSGTLQVSGNGTLAVQFQVPVQVGWSPSSCGPLFFNGSVENNGSVALVFPGTYTWTLPCSGQTFEMWTTKGSATVLTPSSSTSQILISGGGADIWENFSSQGGPPPNGLQRYSVGLEIAPSSCGPVTLDGQSYGSGASGLVTAGTYTVTAPTCQGYTFSSWTTTGGLIPNQPSSITTSVLVQGNGTLTLTYVAASGGPGGGASPPGSNGLSTSETLGIAIALVAVVAVAFLLYARSRRLRLRAGERSPFQGPPPDPAARPGPSAPGAATAPFTGPPPNPSAYGLASNVPGPSLRPALVPSSVSAPPPRPVSPSALPPLGRTGFPRPGPVWQPAAPLSVLEGADEELVWSVVGASGVPASKLLCFTRLLPSELEGRYRLRGATILRISRSEGEGAVAPSDLERIGYLSEKHLSAPGQAVVLPGIESLVEANSVKNVGRLLEVLKEAAQGSQGAVLASLDPRTLDATKVALLERGARRL